MTLAGQPDIRHMHCWEKFKCKKVTMLQQKQPCCRYMASLHWLLTSYGILMGISIMVGELRHLVMNTIQNLCLNVHFSIKVITISTGLIMEKVQAVRFQPCVPRNTVLYGVT